MQPDFFGGNARQGMIERLDMKFGALEKFRFGQILEPGMARHRKIGTIDLQDESSRRDRLVFRRQRRRQRLDIGLVGWIKFVAQERRI